MRLLPNMNDEETLGTPWTPYKLNYGTGYLTCSSTGSTGIEQPNDRVAIAVALIAHLRVRPETRDPRFVLDCV